MINFWGFQRREHVKRDVSDTRPRGPLPSRAEQLEKLKTEQLDVLVIGGGATGSGCALDAASRGLKVRTNELNKAPNDCSDPC